MRRLLVFGAVTVLVTACTGTSADTTAVTTDAGCDELDRVPPESMADDLSVWLRETESERGEVPEDLEGMVFVADFNARFEAGVFARDEAGDFQVLWGGIAATETEIRESITSTVPELPPLLPLCVDVSGFVED
jgi:hypothetical protein